MQAESVWLAQAGNTHAAEPPDELARMRFQVRRRSLAALAATLAPGLPGLAQGRVAGVEAPDQQNWQEFRRRFMEPDGRVIDTANGRVSHSEGQGWALLLAAGHGDRASFDRVLHWTQKTLRRRTDTLFSWRYRPGATPPVDDPNNATDGDLYIAWALLRAAERWRDPALQAAGVAIGRDILRLLPREAAGQLVLLPGMQGFETATELVVNPSYFVFPAYAALARAVPDPRWNRLALDGLGILRQARFGRWGLPPDWLTVRRAGGPLALPSRWPPRFSFDAVRIPLLLAWAGHGAEPAVAAARAFWSDPAQAGPPAWADLATDAVAGFPASPGVRAIASLAAAAATLGLPVAIPSVQAAADYYAAALILLVGLAARDLGLNAAGITH
jgi:endoglucanase